MTKARFGDRVRVDRDGVAGLVVDEGDGLLQVEFPIYTAENELFGVIERIFRADELEILKCAGV